MKDMAMKRRYSLPNLRGQYHPNAKLTRADIVAIRERFAEGARLGALAKVFGVSPDNISRIVKRKTWTHVA